MPRPVDPQRHRARRLHIIDAGLTVFARHGSAGSTTAAICHEAGIGSGTFFHYFKTKEALVLAILNEGAAETTEFFGAQENRTDPVEVVLDWVRHALADLHDPRATGFISVVSGLTAQESVSTLLADQDRLTLTGLTHWLDVGKESGLVRTDLTAERLARWVMLIVDGFAGQVGATTSFDPAVEQPLLLETINTLLNGPKEAPNG